MNLEEEESVKFTFQPLGLKAWEDAATAARPEETNAIRQAATKIQDFYANHHFYTHHNKPLLIGNTQLTSLPEPLPDSVNMLYLNGCKSLKALGSLPSSLAWLHLEGCSSLETLPESLPASLNQMHLKDCSRLRKVPDLSRLDRPLIYVDLRGCLSLESEPKLKHNETYYRAPGNNVELKARESETRVPYGGYA
ncbi:hypothetical protein ACTPOE_14390 [Castellaniella sp. WN]